MTGELDSAPGGAHTEHEQLLRTFLQSKKSRNTNEARARDLGIPLDWVPGREPREARTRRNGPAPRTNPLAWLNWCLAQRLPLGQVQPHHVERWLAALNAAGYRDASRSRMLSHVSALYAFLQRPDIGLVATNPAMFVDRASHHLNKSQQEPPAGHALELPQLRALLEAAWLLAPRTPNGLRDRAMVEVLVTTGVREDELCGVHLGDYHRPSPGASGTLRVHGKGERDRLVYLSEPVCDAVDDYLAVRVAAAVPARIGQVSSTREQPLFVTRHGRRVHTSSVHPLLRRVCISFAADRPAHQRWLRELRASTRGGELARVLGPLADTIHAHQLRRSYATEADKRGMDARQIQQDLGHLRLQTTVGYIDHGRGVLDSAARELSPALHRGWWHPRTTDDAKRAQQATEVPGQISIDDADSAGGTP